MKLPKAPRAVITGGGSGLGRALALRLAARKGRMLIADVNTSRAEETARLVGDRGGEAHALRCDVSRTEDWEQLANRSDELFGGTDLLVNNAGVAAAGAVGDFAIEDWEWIMRINLWGVILGCHTFAPRMKAKRRGAILNVASSAGIASFPEMGAYNVTKAGVISLSETLDAELASFGVTVSVLCPTFFKTNLLETIRVAKEEQRTLAGAMFERSTMTADEVAEAGLRGLERGQLIVIPQADGNVVWRAKRLAPALYRQLVRNQSLNKLFTKMTLKKAPGV